MKVRDLIANLSQFDGDREVEIATCERPDEWFEIYDVETLPNARGVTVVVINTD